MALTVLRLETLPDIESHSFQKLLLFFGKKVRESERHLGDYKLTVSGTQLRLRKEVLSMPLALSAQLALLPASRRT